MHIKTVQNYKIIPSVIPFFIYFSLKTSKINTNTVYMQQNMQTAYKKNNTLDAWAARIRCVADFVS